MELTILLSQAVSLALIAAWITTGVRDNIFHPSLNEAFTAEVLTMARLRIAYPEAYAQVASRAIHSRKLQVAAFRLIVLAELVTAVVLWAGTVMLVLTVFGAISVETARIVGLCGALMFTALWSMFIIVGNHFSYWFCHEVAQQTHFQLALWGLGNVLFLALA